MTPHQIIQQIYRAAIDAVDPRATVRAAIALEDAGRVKIDGTELGVGGEGVFVIAIGKAADSMALGAVDGLGDLVTQGIVVTKEPARSKDERFEYFEGTHPVPDNRSLRAGEAILTFASDVPDGALVLCLISGGGSALVEALKPGVNLDDLQTLTSQLLDSGAPIQDLNTVRSRMSRIKGGGLLDALGRAQVVNLIVSDVLGDDLQIIASGPTISPEVDKSAEEVLRRYSIDFRLPEASARPDRGPVRTRVVASLSNAIDAAALEAERVGLHPLVLADRLEGEAREVGATLATILAGSAHHLSPFAARDCVLAGGETTVTVRGDGVGGRNTEAALAAAMALSGIDRITVGFLATDGDDGLTTAAGAIVDGATISPEELARAREALAANDSYTFLSQVGAVWEPGATGTNVNDLVIGLIE